MKKAGYPPEYAAALSRHRDRGPIIPPSIIMIVYALTETTSSPSCSSGGVVPGLMITGSLLVVNHWVSVRRNYGAAKRATLPEIARASCARCRLVLPFIILGGMHLGIFTPTEASAVAVFYALVVGSLPHARFRRAAGDPVSHRDPHRLYPHDHRSLRSVLLHPDDRPDPGPAGWMASFI